MSKGWIGVDLDGTLAKYDGWEGPLHIGEPVPLMVARVRQWLAEGKEVRIFTARVSEPNMEACAAVRTAIKLWCEKHIGTRLMVTCCKDFGMITLYDDRCVQVEPNTGQLVAPEKVG